MSVEVKTCFSCGTDFNFLFNQKTSIDKLQQELKEARELVSSVLDEKNHTLDLMDKARAFFEKYPKKEGE